MEQSQHIWTQSKSNVYFNLAFIVVVNIICLSITILFWKSLDLSNKYTLLGSFFLAVAFLSMYVLGCTITKENIVFMLPHKKVKMQLSEIESARVSKRWSVEYLEIRTNKRIGIRKRFQFQISKNEEEISEILNGFIATGVKVFTNSTIKTSVRFNAESKSFEFG